MTQLQQIRPLCPHLAAAALWMTRRSPGKRYARRSIMPRIAALPVDEMLAL